MKRMLVLLSLCLLLGVCLLPASAAEGRVIYSNGAQGFVFEPGSEYSPTDLFPDFKGVMPGDSLTQRITVKNEADHKVKVKIYLRSLGAHEDSEDFLSKLSLRVNKSEENEMAYMFDAAADERAQLTDWVCLGTLYSGGEVNLDVILKVPVELENAYQNKIGYLDWEFKVEEYPIEPDDPKPPVTGDRSDVLIWIVLLLSFLAMMIILLGWRKKDKTREASAVKRGTRRRKA